MFMENFIRGYVRRNLFEFFSLADKVYFKSNKLPIKFQEVIQKITRGDAWTKLVSDLVYEIAQENSYTGEWAVASLDGLDAERKDEYEVHEKSLSIEDWKGVKEFYNDLKLYNKNTLPVKGFNVKGVPNTLQLQSALKYRRGIIEQLQHLPSVAMRNLRGDLRIPRDLEEIVNYKRSTETFMRYFMLLKDRKSEMMSKLEKQFFKANITMAQMVDMAEDKSNLLGGDSIDRNSVQDIVASTGGDLEIVYEKGSYMVIKVMGPEGIYELGCNSLWCFSYMEDGHLKLGTWYSHSTNDIVYVIIDFSVPSDNKQFMHVLIKPIDWGNDDEENDETLFSMDNNSVYNPIWFFKNTIGLDVAKQILDFDEN